MTQDVILNLTSRLEDGRRSPEILQFMTEGRLKVDERSVQLCYLEDGDAGEAPCSTVIDIAGDGLVSICRSGSRNGVLLLQQGKRMLSTYDTGCGLLQLCVSATRVRSRFDGSNGTVELAYELELEGEHLGSNDLTIGVKPAGDYSAQKGSVKP